MTASAIAHSASSRPATMPSRSSCSAARSSQIDLHHTILSNEHHAQRRKTKSGGHVALRSPAPYVDYDGRRITSSWLQPSSPETSWLLPSSPEPSWLAAFLARSLLRCGLLRRSLLRCGLLRRSLLRCGLLRRSLLGCGLLGRSPFLAGAFFAATCGSFFLVRSCCWDYTCC